MYIKFVGYELALMALNGPAFTPLPPLNGLAISGETFFRLPLEVIEKPLFYLPCSNGNVIAASLFTGGR